MSTVLKDKLRPKSFNKLWGQESVVNAIRKQIASKRIPQAWMFVGETGSGKTSIAQILTRALNCTHITSPAKFGSFCKKCEAMKDQHAANIIEINGAKTRKVEEISNLTEMCTYAPIPPSRKRVFIIDEAHCLSKEAQNVLLIPTERPAKTTVWIICTTEAHAILKTLRRRFTIYAMNPLKHRVAEEFIEWAAQKAGIKRSLDDLIEYVHKENVTSPSIILDILEKYGAGFDPDKAAATGPTGINTMRISKGILSGEWGHVRPELDRATESDVRLIRAAVLGLFKHELLKHTPGASRKLLVKGIESLGNVPYALEEASQLALFSARCWQLCQEFRKQ